MLEPRVDILMRIGGPARPVEWIRKALESVEAQTETNWHISSEVVNTPHFTPVRERYKVLCEFSKKHPNKVGMLCTMYGKDSEHTRDLDGEQRAYMFLAGSAPYIAILDDDDYWMPETLDVLVGALEAAPEAHLAFANYMDIDAEGNEITEGVWHRWELFTFERLMERKIIMFPFVARRSAIEAVGGFDSSLQCASGYDLLVKLTEPPNPPPIQIDRVLAAVRHHDLRISRRLAREQFESAELLKARARERMATAGAS